MGLWNNFVEAWKKERTEAAFNKRFDKKPIPEGIQDEKAQMTAKGEPWVGILRMEVDPNNLSDGAFELDWNPIFVARLVKAGYTGRDDKAIVEQWFNRVCENVVAGTYEQEMSDPDKRKRIQRRRLNNEREEVS
jgi:hypothetical protein